MPTLVEQVRNTPGFDQLPQADQEELLRKAMAKEGGTPALPPPRNPYAPTGKAGETWRVPYGVAKGALSHTLGLIPDLVNLVYGRGVNPPVISGDLSMQRPEKTPGLRLPIGSQDIARGIDTVASLVGYTPPPAGTYEETAEKMATTFGGFAGPGWLTRLAGLVQRLRGANPAVMQDITKTVSAGPVQDVVLGTTAVIGEQAAGPWGAVVAPLAVSAGHGLASKALTTTGKHVLPKQAVREATDDVTAAESRLAEAKAREVDAQTHAEAKEQRTIAGAETYKTTTGEAVDRAKRQLATTPTEVETTLQTHVPGAPATPAGTAATAAVGTAADEVRTGITRTYEGMLHRVGPAVERMRTLDAAVQGFRHNFAEWRGTKNRLFRAVEAVTGNEPVVVLNNTHRATRRVLNEAEVLGQHTPTGTGAVHMLGREQVKATPEEMLELLRHNPRLANLKDPEYSRAVQQLVEAFERGTMQDVPIPFWLARRLESVVGEMAWRNTKPVGTISQGRARQIWYGLQDDMRQFFETHPAGQQVATDLRQAKDLYIEGVNLYNNSIVKHLLSHNPKEREQFLDRFVATTNLSEIAEIQAHASPEVWNLLRAHVLADIAERASVNGVLQPERLAQQARRLEAHGKIDLLLSPEEKAQFRALVQEAQAVKANPTVRLHKELAGKDSAEIPSYVFAPGEYRRTEQFKAMTPVEVYDQTVKAWAGQFVERLATMTPEQAMKVLRPLVRREGGQPSQLDLILDQYPGVADTIADMVQRHDATRRSLPQLQRTQELAQEGARETKRLAGEEYALTMDPYEQATRTAEAQMREATQRLKEARRAAGMREDATIHHAGGWLHAGGVFLSTHRLDIASVLTLIGGVLTGSPYALTAGAIAGGAALGLHGLKTTATGQRWMREGLARAYGPASLRFAAQVLAQPTPDAGATPAQPTAPTAVPRPRLELTEGAVRTAMQETARELGLTERPTDPQTLARYRAAVAARLRSQGYTTEAIQQAVGH